VREDDRVVVREHAGAERGVGGRGRGGGAVEGLDGGERRRLVLAPRCPRNAHVQRKFVGLDVLHRAVLHDSHDGG